MPHFLMHYWRAWSSRASFTHASAASADPADDTATRAEQLEDIAVYARAGYFDMGYTSDAFQPPSN